MLRMEELGTEKSSLREGILWTNFLYSCALVDGEVFLHIDLRERGTPAKSPTGIKPDVLALLPLRHLRRRCYRRPRRLH